tara:strand:- start:482 stop:607 length:126 start_codon:yes stop_codon:yes gene_type:complete
VLVVVVMEGTVATGLILISLVELKYLKKVQDVAEDSMSITH